MGCVVNDCGVIYVVAGIKNISSGLIVNKSIYTYDTKQCNPTWNIITTTPPSGLQEDFACVLYANRYICTFQFGDENYRYDIQENRWDTITVSGSIILPEFEPVYGFAYSEPNLYILNYDDQNTNNIYTINLSQIDNSLNCTVYRTTINVPSGNDINLQFSRAHIVNNYLYIVGDQTKHVYKIKIDTITPDNTVSLESYNQINIERYNFGITSIQNCLYILGGTLELAVADLQNIDPNSLTYYQSGEVVNIRE